MDDLTQLVAAYVAKAYEVARDKKPEATQFEIEGLTFRILVSALDNYKQNEQLQKSSPIEGTERIEARPKPLQKTGVYRRIEKSPKGILEEQRGTTKSGKRKRRGKKA